MSHAADIARYAGGLYRSAFRRAARPVEKVEADTEHLHDIERRGESGVTPLIAIGGLILFLLPIFLIMLGLAFAAYYLAA
jgi:hypothetical protein